MHLHDTNLAVAGQDLDAIDLALADVQRLHRQHLALGFALRLRHHDAKLHKRFNPEGEVAGAAFEALEQIRVEALGASRMAGVAANLASAHAARGRRQLSPELLDGVLGEFGGLAREATRRTADLSPEDCDILRLASEGSTNREIGMAMGRSEIAIKKRLQVIFSKLGAVDRAHAVAEAIRRGLI